MNLSRITYLQVANTLSSALQAASAQSAINRLKFKQELAWGIHLNVICKTVGLLNGTC